MSNVGSKTYEIGFKQYHGEMSDWGYAHVVADDKNDALRRFAAQRGIEMLGADVPETWRWEEDGWLTVFRYIKEVSVRLCPHCAGAGSVKTYDDQLNG